MTSGWFPSNRNPSKVWPTLKMKRKLAPPGAKSFLEELSPTKKGGKTALKNSLKMLLKFKTTVCTNVPFHATPVTCTL